MIVSWSPVIRCVTLALVLAALGCTGNPTQPDGVPLGRPFELRAGSSALLDDGLRMRFDSVRSDSRCPMDALCVWVGDAVVALSLSQSGDQAELELHTERGQSETSYAAYSIRLDGLQPYPRSDRRIAPEDYIATFTVRMR